ncbi:hypothetical protein L207DRAFT_188640 [Hyaloscypha variabilis F]|uniref:Uncharacterized protein n=1 Tax=Hyaloscypha variabilis (strain UAMH 11265 / GT02V1 / F) TaxID=1149755 RepID=A0A2J6QYW8_HYAVF|nr:hypothetical protein L207DRAFT_188640 [Hyaloscypha variabilis F]
MVRSHSVQGHCFVNSFKGIRRMASHRHFPQASTIILHTAPRQVNQDGANRYQHHRSFNRLGQHSNSCTQRCRNIRARYRTARPSPRCDRARVTVASDV